jgi:hypothetical protein
MKSNKIMLIIDYKPFSLKEILSDTNLMRETLIGLSEEEIKPVEMYTQQSVNKTITKEQVEILYAHQREPYCKEHLFTINNQITKTQAIKLQTELGYHPAGYSFLNFKSSATQTTWECWNSCD